MLGLWLRGISGLRARLGFVALALGTIAVGLAVHWRGTLLPPTLGDPLGDALWAMMIGWWIGALAPATRPAPRAGLALAICWMVEISQLYHAPDSMAGGSPRWANSFLVPTLTRAISGRTRSVYSQR